MKGLARSAVPVFDHLQRMTDNVALFEHAKESSPREEHGYCVDDVARALVVVLRQPNADLGVVRLAQRYLDFVIDAVDSAGLVHNRHSARGSWTDQASMGDWWGRAVWALGTAVESARDAGMRVAALEAFNRCATQRSADLMPTVFAGLGAQAVLHVFPADPVSLRLLNDVIERVGPPVDSPTWPWPEPRLRYSSGHVAEALLYAGVATADGNVIAHALTLLSFVLEQQTHGDHLSPTPVGGRGEGDERPAFDQQPIEVAALADACAGAWDITRDENWRLGVGLAWAWFCGANDSNTQMFDLVSGGCFDGLEMSGPNLNQGAESTIAAISTAQHARRLGLLK